jgi:hypothetical protein
MSRRYFLLRVAAGAAIVAGLAVLGTAVAFVRNHRHSTETSAATAEAEFARLRARFPDQRPLLDMSLRTAHDSSLRSTSMPLKEVHTVIFDTRGGDRLVHISVPYWFAKRFARHENGNFVWLGELTFLDDTEFDPEPIQLSLAQLERHGPGSIVDYRHAQGGQFISWVE